MQDISTSLFNGCCVSSGGVVIVYERKVKLLYGKLSNPCFHSQCSIKIKAHISEFSYLFFNFTLFSRRGRDPFSGISSTLINISYEFCFVFFTFLCISFLWVKKVEINEAWKVKTAPDPTLLPKSKSKAKLVTFCCSLFKLCIVYVTFQITT